MNSMIKTSNFLLFAGLILFLSCQKTENLIVDFNKLNPDNYVPSALDNWLVSTFTDKYNIEVIYRHDRYKTDVARNVSPPREEKVRPQMEAVLKGFLLPYEQVAGSAFIKKYTPKQFVLFGSGSYNDDGSYNLGTAAGGRNITLYDLNAFNDTDADNVRRRLRTIHHEFVHIFQQNATTPLDFELITVADYYTDWTNNTENSETIARNLGFISRYARSQPFEDFAETAAHLLVEGQEWYDNYARQSTASGYTKLKEKESAVVNYFRLSFDLDFRKVQREIQRVLREEYYHGSRQSFGRWFFQESLFNAAYTLNVNAPDYQQSPAFKAAFDALATAVRAQSSTALYSINSLTFTFNRSDNTLVIRMPFTATAGGQAGTTFSADYNFAYAYNASTGEVTFTKTEQGTGTVYNNANLFLTAFNNTISAYLTGTAFVPDWSPHTAEWDTNQYRNFGGFYDKDNPSSYFFTPLVRATP